MNWQDVRGLYPERWVVIEALDAFSEDGRRVIPIIRVHGDYGDNWNGAWAQYKELHQTDNQREYYVLHTSREALDIGVIDAFWHVMG